MLRRERGERTADDSDIADDCRTAARSVGGSAHFVARSRRSAPRVLLEDPGCWWGVVTESGWAVEEVRRDHGPSADDGAAPQQAMMMITTTTIHQPRAGGLCAGMTDRKRPHQIAPAFGTHTRADSAGD